MVNLYLDTSAAVKLLVEEAESAALATALTELDPADRLLSSRLLHTELHCAAGRRPEAVDPESVEAVLARVVLVDLARADLVRAPSVGVGLRSRDAIHLVVAIRAGVDAVITYDDEQAAAAQPDWTFPGRADRRLPQPGDINRSRFLAPSAPADGVAD